MTLVRILPMLLLGLVLTAKGGDLFVDAAVWIAQALSLPRFLVGATLVSVATTLPEVAVSLMAAARGATGIAAGNAVGSVSANLGLILGLCLLISPVPAGRDDLVMMAGAAALLTLLCAEGSLSAPGAAAMLCVCLAFMAKTAVEGRALLSDPGRPPRPGGEAVATQIAKFVAGAAGIAAGARLLSDYGAALARLLGVSEGVIGATLVAVGTSLPELVTAVAALRRGQASLSVGNIVGANLIDLTLILPLCALTGGAPLPLPRQSLVLDLPFCLFLALIAALPALPGRRFYRWQGIALAAVYGVYVTLVVKL